MEEKIKKIMELSNCLDNIGWEINDAVEALNDLEIEVRNQDNNCIKDVNNLKRELKRDGLYSEKMEEFLENYMRYYNR